MPPEPPPRDPPSATEGTGTSFRVPAAGPSRVLRARPSAKFLRESVPGLLLVGGIAFALGTAITVLVWTSFDWAPSRRPLRQHLRHVRAVVTGAPLWGYGLVCLVRAGRMARRAREASREQPPGVD